LKKSKLKSLSEKQKEQEIELKILSALLLYFYGLSLRKASKFLSLFQQISYNISHESIRIYYHRIKRILEPPGRKIDCNKRDQNKAEEQTDLCKECNRCLNTVKSNWKLL